MPAIHSIAREHGAAVAEDACHALGGSCVAEGGQQNPIGACADSDMAVFSFHPVKLVAMGEGGVVTTNDAVLQERLARLRTHGMEKDPGRFQSPALAFDKDGSVNPWYYEMAEYGFNYRVSDVNCALGLSQLRKMDRFLNRRKELAALYDRRLGPLAPCIRPVPRVPYGQSGWHIYAVLIDFATAGVTRAQAMNRLRERGIGTQVHYLPVHMQPYYQNRYGALELPGARAYYERILSLPFYPGMEDEDVERVVKSLEEVLT
jgi:dTDP-4-amino-4,6-dideoxygalactose transaminase